MHYIYYLFYTVYYTHLFLAVVDHLLQPLAEKVRVNLLLGGVQVGVPVRVTVHHQLA